MAQFEIIRTCELTNPPQTHNLHGSFFTEDNIGQKLGFAVVKGGVSQTLNGTVTANVIRADNATMYVTGSVSGNVASIELPKAALSVNGPCVMQIRLTSGTQITTLGRYGFTVQLNSTDTIVDPGRVIPSLEELLAKIEEMETATTAANSAATNANTKAELANTAATRADTAVSALENMDATAQTLAPGASATASVSTVSGHYRLTLGVPKGLKGDTGDNASITSTVTAYQNSTSGNTVPSGTWLDAQPTTPQGQYLWTRTTINWNNNQTTVLYSVSRQGIDGMGSVSSVNGISPDSSGNVVLPVDAVPTDGSSNPVSSDGVFDALASKAPIVSLADGTDANNIKAPGLYYLGTNGTNLPGTALNGYILVIGNGTITKQLFMRRGTNGTNDSQTYVRQYNGSSWGNWTEVLTERSVSYSAGNTYSVGQGVPLAGLISANSKTLYFTIYTPKSLANISTVSVTSFVGGARHIGGGYIGSGNASSPWAGSDTFEWVGASNVTVSADKISDNIIRVALASSVAFTEGNSTTEVTNNTPVNILAKWTLAFS